MKEGNSFETYLATHGRLVYTQIGTSMWPLLRQGKDMLIVERKTAKRCRAGDVALYRTPPHRYVLHRVIQVREMDYVMLGDHCFQREPGLRDEDILGVLTGYVRNGREHSVDEPGYRLYTFLLMHTIQPRIWILRRWARLKRGIRSWIHAK